MFSRKMLLLALFCATNALQPAMPEKKMRSNIERFMHGFAMGAVHGAANRSVYYAVDHGLKTIGTFSGQSKEVLTFLAKQTATLPALLASYKADIEYLKKNSSVKDRKNELEASQFLREPQIKTILGQENVAYLEGIVHNPEREYYLELGHIVGQVAAEAIQVKEGGLALDTTAIAMALWNYRLIGQGYDAFEKFFDSNGWGDFEKEHEKEMLDHRLKALEHRIIILENQQIQNEIDHRALEKQGEDLAFLAGLIEKQQDTITIKLKK
jgi:hypothetical protein